MEEQLRDGRKWLFDTITPSLADISVYFVLSWIQTLKLAQGLITEQTYPQALHWLSRVKAHLDTEKASNATEVADVNGEQAAKMICSSNSESADVVGLDHTELGRLGLEANERVVAFPEDTGG